ncbi:MAG: glucuronate isomerase, partial [Chitinophagaceae bacterium]
MKKFLCEDFLLHSKTAQQLYHEYAAHMPIIDYHNHLPPDQIADDTRFENLSQVWLLGDHYKWRAMRANGINEKYCTGDGTDKEKFEQWAATVPQTLRNPLYHWSHLELQRYFNIDKLLSPDSATEIYEECNFKLQTQDYSVRNLLRKMNVKILCTTDDPTDTLEHHQRIKNDNFEIHVLPSFRPDKTFQVDDPVIFNQYVGKLEGISDTAINSYEDYLAALKKRHDFFAEMGCSVADHGLDHLSAEEYTETEIKSIFDNLRMGNKPDPGEIAKFKSAMLIVLAEWNWERGWVQQYHLGAMRNNNSRKKQQLGADTGWDSIGDYSQAQAVSKFLDRLDKNDKLTKTVIYNLNPADNEVMATMIGNFNDGSAAGKIQWGSAWWFMDQKEGMEKQLNTLSSMGLLSRFIGMLTDSRSFLSFPSHEYFRRILCNLLGDEIEKGELPNDINMIG